MQTAFLDCREDYDAAMRGLASDPNDAALHYQAILALARAGSLDEARAGYQEFGLARHTDNEDYLCLGGRLLKDASLRVSGLERAQLAKSSAAQYQIAFERTGGYYSGINAATMTFLAGGDAVDISQRANQVIKSLPGVEGLSDQSAYFVLATRGEALLLLDDQAGAQSALIQAWERDPLNYINHAATLKQFKLICERRRQDPSWMAAFAPPKAAQFAGQMFSVGDERAPGTNISQREENQLRDQVIRLIQDEDIGFFFGALSAGFDLLAAEVILEEGGEVHVVLPIEKHQFREASVVPFGHGWTARFEAVMDQASSIDIVAPQQTWPDRELNRYAAKISMGKAILRANLLSAGKVQVMAFADSNVESYTRDHKDDWRETGYSSFQLEIPGRYRNRFEGAEKPRRPFIAEILIHDQHRSVTHRFSDALSAARNAIEQLAENIGGGLGIVCSDRGEDLQALALVEHLSNKALPGSLLVSEHFACLLAVEAEDEFSISYVGRVDPNQVGSPGVYSLSRKA